MKTTTNNAGEDGVVCPRQSMAALPKFLQPSLTWLTGKPLPGQTPLVKRTHLSHVITAYGTFLGGIAISMGSFATAPWLLPVGWILTVSGAPKIIPTLNHYCVHGDLLPKRLCAKYGWLHPYIADFNSALLFLQDFVTYRDEHLSHHRPNVVASIIDADMAFLWQLGFKAGMTKSQLWRNYFVNIISPFSKLHRLFIKSRVKTILFKGNPLRWAVQLIALAVLGTIAYSTSFSLVFWACIFPMTYLYHIASLSQFVCEHMWLTGVENNGLLNLSNKDAKKRGKRITSARFCGEAIPVRTTSRIKYYGAWVSWSAKMLCVHLPIRLFVLSGDLVVHDWHHVCGHFADWPNAFFARALAVANPKEGDAPYTEVWGIKNAINRVFASLSKMEPIDPALIEKDDNAVLGM